MIYRTRTAMTVALCGLFLGGVTHGSAQNGNPEMARFDGDAVVRARVETPGELETALNVAVDIWSHSIGLGEIDLQVPCERLDQFTEHGIDYEILIDDVQALIDAERERLDNPLDGPWFEEYKSYEEVDQYLDTLVNLRPDLASRFDVGLSHEGRTIYGLRITSPGGDPKPATLINSCQHAREWISVMVSMYVADTLIRNYDSDPRIQNLVDSHEFFIVPIANPDGYVYTWTSNRMWRKNRRNNGDGSFGVDLNRNWEYEWGGIGSSPNPSSDLYRGPFPFSEPETTALADFIVDHPTITKHIDFHNYSQYVLHPWAFTPDPTPHHDIFTDLSTAMEAAIEAVHGMNYIPGTWYSVLYPSSGVMIDWVYARRGGYSFTVELRDRGQFGFLLPPEQIIPTSEEAFEGFAAMVEANVDSIMTLEASDLDRGQRAGLQAFHATPTRAVHFVYSFTGEGQTPVPPLNVTLDLDQPRYIGATFADAAGVARLIETVPPNAPRRVIWLQAAEYGRVTNVVVTQIN